MSFQLLTVLRKWSRYCYYRSYWIAFFPCKCALRWTCRQQNGEKILEDSTFAPSQTLPTLPGVKTNAFTDTALTAKTRGHETIHRVFSTIGMSLKKRKLLLLLLWTSIWPITILLGRSTECRLLLKTFVRKAQRSALQCVPSIT